MLCGHWPGLGQAPSPIRESIMAVRGSVAAAVHAPIHPRSNPNLPSFLPAVQPPPSSSAPAPAPVEQAGRAWNLGNCNPPATSTLPPRPPLASVPPTPALRPANHHSTPSLSANSCRAAAPHSLSSHSCLSSSTHQTLFYSFQPIEKVVT